MPNPLSTTLLAAAIVFALLESVIGAVVFITIALALETYRFYVTGTASVDDVPDEDVV